MGGKTTRGETADTPGVSSGPALDSAWELVEGTFFAKGIEEDLAAIEHYETLAKTQRTLPHPAPIRGRTLALAGCAAGVLAIVSFGVVRSMRKPAHAAAADEHAGATVAENPGSSNPALMPSLPSSKTESQDPPMAGAPAGALGAPKPEPVIAQAE